jgi:gamma-glutamyltranspeptidase/glutathione hydrolase
MVSPMPFTTRPEIEGTFGVVASTHWIATAVGMAMLEKGGNAFDAAVAAAFTLHLVEPHLNGPAGDVPVLVYDVRLGKPTVICGQGPAPRAATIAKFTSMGLDMVPGSGCSPRACRGRSRPDDAVARSRHACVARCARARDLLRQPRPTLVERASATIATVEPLFRDHWKTSAAVYLPGGKVPAPERC